MKVYYDLHIHSVLSPCADDDMTPNNIVNMAWLKGLDIIAVTDHNQCGNLGAIQELAKERDILLIPGMEVESREGVHLLCYFKSFENAFIMEKEMYSSLPNLPCTEFFGKQQLMDEEDKVIGNLDKLLISSTKFSIDEIYDIVKKLDGIMGYAHIYRKSNGILNVLGFLPESPKVSFIEINSKNEDDSAYKRKMRIISNSDAHRLVDMNEAINCMNLDDKTIKSVFKWLGGF